MDLPRYCIVGARPVKLVQTDDGGMTCMAFNWDTGEIERDMTMLTRALLPDGEVDIVTEEEFDQAVSRLREEQGEER
jgi:hypothetical protein